MSNILAIVFNIITGGALVCLGALMMSGAFGALAGGFLPGGRGFSGRFATPAGAFFASAIITACVQSSSAVTVVTVSMANAGVLSLASAMAAVYGANIGTCATSQLMSLDISAAGIYILAAGAALWVIFLAAGRRAAVPKAVTGLGLLFTGLSALKASAALIKGSGYVMNFINYYSGSGLWCVFFGFATTALVHSSSATVGLTIALFSGGVIGFREAVFITLGDNIGTCVTAQLAATACGEQGRRVAWGNMIYNTVCAIVAYIFIDAFTETVVFITRALGQSESSLVANAHTLFNILGALLFLPLNDGFCRFLTWLIGGETVRGNYGEKMV